MKLLVLSAVLSVCAAGALNQNYLPPNGGSYRAAAHSGYSGAASAQVAQQAAYSGAYQQQSARPQAALERNAAILRFESEVNPDNYHFNYETENGIKAEENGQEADGIQAQGGYTYTGDDGQVYSVSYSAGAGGFQPQGAHIPTPPPVPEEILRALEQNARDEAAGIIDDGQYHEASSGHAAAVAGQYKAQGSYNQGFKSQSGYRY